MNAPSALFSSALLLVLSACAGREEGVAGPIPPGLAVQLVYRAPLPEQFFPTRAVADETRLYAESASGSLFAFDLASGAQVWTVPTPDDEFLGQPVVHGGRVLTTGKYVRAMDAATGALLWQRPLAQRSFMQLTAASEGRFFTGIRTTVMAVDVATGDSLWATPLGEAWPNGGRVRALSARDGVVYACLQELVEDPGWRTAGHIIALNASDGTERWRYRWQFETEYNFCVGEPNLAGDVVTVADAGGNNFLGLDRTSGVLRWRHQGESGFLGPSVAPAGPGDTLFAASNDGNVLALDRATGGVIWSARTSSSAKDAVACGRVVLASDYSLWVFDRATGRLLADELATKDVLQDFLASRFIVRGSSVWVVGGTSLLRLRCRA